MKNWKNYSDGAAFYQVKKAIHVWWTQKFISKLKILFAAAKIDRNDFSIKRHRIDSNYAVHAIVLPLNICDDVSVVVKKARAVREKASSITLIDDARHDKLEGLFQIHNFIDASTNNQIGPIGQFVSIKWILLTQNLLDDLTNDLIYIVNLQVVHFLQLRRVSKGKFKYEQRLAFPRLFTEVENWILQFKFQLKNLYRLSSEKFSVVPWGTFINYD